MSIEDDVALLERVPTLRLLGTDALRMLAIGSEQRVVARGDALFNAGDEADAGFVVQRGAFRIEDGAGAETIAGPGALIGELALIVAMKRPSTATALEQSAVIRVCAQPVSARAGKRSRRRAPAARRLCQPLQPARQRHPDGGRQAEHLAGDSAQTSSVTVTGTWSDGRSQPRASRRILKSLTASFSARDTQM